MSPSTPESTFPPVRACLFDMDGLLLNTEDIYSLCTNLILERYNRPPLPWSIKAQLMGRPGPTSGAIFYSWAQLPITQEEYATELSALQRQEFPKCGPLPGVEKLLENLATAKTESGDKVHLALATSSHEVNFNLKTSHLVDLFEVFEKDKRVLGDDLRIPKGRGKPAPEIYLLALECINSNLSVSEKKIEPKECLVFEDSVMGVEAGRRAGMRVVWVPHPDLKKEYTGREEDVLAAKTGEGSSEDLHQLGEVRDGWGDFYNTLENFPYNKYGMVVQG